MAPTRTFAAALIGAVAVAIGMASFFPSISFLAHSKPGCAALETNLTTTTTTLANANATTSPSSSINGREQAPTTISLFSTPGLPQESSSSSPPSLSERMGFRGKRIPECSCSFCELEEANLQSVHPLLQQIVATPFFSHFQIDLCTSCELWEDAPQCSLKDCSVCECAAPPAWAHHGPERPLTGPAPECSYNNDDAVVTAVDQSVLDGWNLPMEGGIGGIGGAPSVWMQNGEPTTKTLDHPSSGAQVVDLLKNPERYTGYSGPSAQKVWSAIHSQNCFQGPNSTQGENNKLQGESDDFYCSLSPEQRLYNRFVSGLHSSISLHIAHSYCWEMDPHVVGECRLWGPNDAMAYDRVLRHSHRVENLYVAFSLLLRAVVKAESAIGAAVPASDPILRESLQHWQESLFPALLRLQETTPWTFDESGLLEELLKDKSSRTELQRRFQELQSMMQCVGCDRCKLWGTLQTLGMGTALRLLCHTDESSSSSSNPHLHLSRQEAVALVNTLERLSSSLVFAKEFWARREDTKLFCEKDKMLTSC